jgi:hypothetical protein
VPDHDVPLLDDLVLPPDPVAPPPANLLVAGLVARVEVDEVRERNFSPAAAA